MVIDTSAVIAILNEEPDARQYAEAVAAATAPVMAAGTFLEIAVVLARAADPARTAMLDPLIAQSRISVLSFTAEQAILARAAYRTYGRGSGHPAKLNFGDCFAYATAKDLNLPLLYKGGDFGHTDIRSAI